MRTIIFVFIFLIGFAEAASAAASQATIRRFALITASGEGGPGRVPLRYAHSDAQAVAKVLRELGGVNAGDTLVLLDTDRKALQREIQKLGDRLKEAQKEDTRVELFVYYSGHSDEQGLLFGNELVTYAEFRKMLDQLLADVRIAVLDSCASGALTRAKGGKQRAPFLVDASAKVKGHAFLTSSSADEVAQESDAIAASFFTYFLVSGLRGAADFNRDNRVTLNEAYQFAFQETLARTQKTRGGAQHAAYDIALSGAGDLVLTDLRQTSASLELAEELKGRVFIRNASGQLVVELNKFPGRSVELGLEPGRYQIVLEHNGKLFEAYVQLQNGKQARLSHGHLTAIEGELTAFRGAGSFSDAATQAVAAAKPPKKYKTIPASFLLLPRVSTEGLEGRDERNFFSFNLFAGHAARLDGFEISTGLNSRSDQVNGVQLGIAGNLAGLGWWSNPDAAGDVRGAQVAVGINAARGDLSGVQAAVGGNLTGGKVEAAQFAVGANLAESVDGIQAAVGFNGAGLKYSLDEWERPDAGAGLQLAVGANLASGPVKYGQAAVGANLATGDVKHFQLAVGANVANEDVRYLQSAVGGNYAAGDFHGLQTAVGVNATRGSIYGFQSAVGGNYAYRVTGVQAAQGINFSHGLVGLQTGVINITPGDITGLQAGLINVGGKAHGLQLGLLNYNEDITGASIGLLSYSRGQPVRVLTWVDDVNLMNVGVKLHGSRYVYNLLAVGGQPAAPTKRWSLGWGIGAHVPIRELYVNADAMVHNIRYPGDPSWRNNLAQGRFVVGWRLRERFAIFAGTTYNVHVSHRSSENFGKSITAFGTDKQDEKKFRLRTWEGFVLGVEI